MVGDLHLRAGLPALGFVALVTPGHQDVDAGHTRGGGVAVGGAQTSATACKREIIFILNFTFEIQD